MTEKPKLMLVTNPDEVAAVRAGIYGKLDQPIGGESRGQCWAYKWSMERYRAAQKGEVCRD